MSNIEQAELTNPTARPQRSGRTALWAVIGLAVVLLAVASFHVSRDTAGPSKRQMRLAAS